MAKKHETENAKKKKKTDKKRHWNRLNICPRNATGKIVERCTRNTTGIS